MEWLKIPLKKTKTAKHNTIDFVPGPIGIAKNAKTPKETFKLFFDSYVISRIVFCKNLFIDKLKKKKIPITENSVTLQTKNWKPSLVYSS